MRLTTQLQSLAGRGQAAATQPPAQPVRPGTTGPRPTTDVPVIWRKASVDGPLPQRRGSSTRESKTHRWLQAPRRALEGWLRHLDLRQRNVTPPRGTGGIPRAGTPMPADLSALAQSAPIMHQARALVAARPDAHRVVKGQQWLIVFCAPAAATPTDSQAQSRQIDAIVARLRSNPKARCVLSGGSRSGPAAARGKHDSAFYRAAIRTQFISLDLENRLVPENRATNLAEQAWNSVRLLDGRARQAPKAMGQMVLVCLNTDRLEATQWLLAARQRSNYLSSVDIAVDSFD